MLTVMILLLVVHLWIAFFLTVGVIQLATIAGALAGLTRRRP